MIWRAFLNLLSTTTILTTTGVTLVTIISSSDKFCITLDSSPSLRLKLLPLRRPPNGQILRRTRKRLIDGGRSLNTFFAGIRERQLTVSDEATPNTAKLSILQKQILLVALRWHGKAHADVYTEDVKIEAFGWQPMRRYWNGWQPSIIVQPGTARLSEDHPSMPNWRCHEQMFDRQSIGESRYNVVSASISRALKRLSKRHLLFRSGAGWSLTDQGLDVARTFAPKPSLSAECDTAGQAA